MSLSTVKCFNDEARSWEDIPMLAYEGGPINYASFKVSLRPISKSDNRGSGIMWNKLTSVGGRMSNGTKVIIAPLGPTSFYIRDGRIGF